MKHKPTLLIDLDGVLNKYTGNYDENYIPEIKEGAKEFLENIHFNYKLVLFTTRKKNLTQQWLKNNNIEKYFASITNNKIPAFLIIDDRCICFDGNYKNLINCITKFDTWYKY